MRTIKRIHRAIIVMSMLALLAALLPIGTAFGASLTVMSDVLAPKTESVAATHTITFTVASELPLDGKIKVTATDFTWPADGDKVANVTVTDDGGSVTLASATVTQASKWIVIVLNHSGAVAADSVVVVTLGSAIDITNPAASGNYTVSVETLTSADAAIDSGNTSAAVGEGETYQFGTIAGTTSLVTIVPGSESNVTLDGTKKTSTWTSAENTDDWNVVDARGTGAGWHVVVGIGSMTDSTANRPTDEVMTLNESSTTFTDNTQYAVKIKILTSTTQDGDNGIVHNADGDGSTRCDEIAGTDTFTHLTGAGLTVATAAQYEGMGAFSLLPQIEVTVPAGAYANASTNFTLTVTLVED